MVRILHAADLHLDSRFEALPAKLAAVRRREQRELAGKIFALAEKNKVDLVLLAGDVFDSERAYSDTMQTLLEAFRETTARIFISPGNHDRYTKNSPYAVMQLPDNVYVFRRGQMRKVELPEYGCTVYGAAFLDSSSPPLLKNWRASGNGVKIGVIHGDILNEESQYSPVSEEDIENSNLDYLALGHNHAFSGVKKTGNTFYACPGCPEGRGFDESGKKGVLLGEVGKEYAQLDFVPLGGREYIVFPVDISGKDVWQALEDALPEETQRDIYRIILTGSSPAALNVRELSEKLEERFFHVSVRDFTHPERDIWERAGANSLRGVFLAMMKERYNNADERQRRIIVKAVRYALAAMDNREEWR